MANLHFYPRSPCGERREAFMALWNEYVISIHALLAESDPAGKVRPWASHISIHALLAESDRPGITRYYAGRHFYPRSPCGERLCDPKIAKNGITISIHALLAESDSRHNLCPRKGKNFYPRSPCGERHNTIRIMQIASIISIHALLAESDFVGVAQGSFAGYISIHALLAESDNVRRDSGASPPKFLSTLSLRRATHQQGCHQDH